MTFKAPFPVNDTLTAIALGYRNKGFIADQLMPRATVDAPEFRWSEYDLEHFRIDDTKVGRKGIPNEVEFTAKEHTDSVQDHGLEDAIPHRDIQAASRSRMRPVQRATLKLTEKLMLAREKRVADLVQSGTNYNHTEALSGTDLFTDAAAKPLITLNDGLETPFMRPNTIVMPRPVLTAIRCNPSVIKSYNGTLGDEGLVPLQFIRDTLDVENILIAEARYQTAARTNTDDSIANLGRIWGNAVAMLYLDPQAQPDDSITWGLTAQWGGRVAGDWEDKNIGLLGGRRIRVGEMIKELVLSKEAGFLYTNVI